LRRKNDDTATATTTAVGDYDFSGFGVNRGVLNLLAGIGVVGLLPIYGLLLLVLAAAALAFGFGAWTGKPWAWMLGVGLYGLNIVLQIVFLLISWATISSVILPIVIAGVIIYYLMTPDVKKYFGRA
jgi:hypothetical protein